MAGRKIRVLGRLAAMSLAQLRQELQHRGLLLVSGPKEAADTLVLGEKSFFSVDDAELNQVLAETQTISQPAEVIWESELWRRLGLLQSPEGVRKLYTPGLVARLVNVPEATIRRWQSLGLIVPAQVVCHLPYYDYQEVIRAQNLAQMEASGSSARRLLTRWARLARENPFFRSAFRRWPVVWQENAALFRADLGLVDFSGQLQFEFSPTTPASPEPSPILSLPGFLSKSFGKKDFSSSELLALAAALDEDSKLAEAAEVYRVALMAAGPQPEICFRLADVLYRLGDLPAARERYLMTIELDPDFAPAYLNLGSVLHELGERDLALAALEGALNVYPDYADAHFLIAQVLKELGRVAEARHHWQQFLELVPEGPWCELARAFLEAMN